MRTLRWVAQSLMAFAFVSATFAAGGDGQEMNWRVGIGRRVITPQTPVWLAGYGTKRAPDGKIHDLWVKVLALRAPDGKRVVMATTDHMGMSKTIYESLYAKVNRRFSLGSLRVHAHLLAQPLRSRPQGRSGGLLPHGRRAAASGRRVLGLDGGAGGGGGGRGVGQPAAGAAAQGRRQVHVRRQSPREHRGGGRRRCWPKGSR